MILTGPDVILSLKIAVLAVTFLFLTSLLALSRVNYWLYGRINIAFFGLTATALMVLEVLVLRVLAPVARHASRRASSH